MSHVIHFEIHADCHLDASIAAFKALRGPVALEMHPIPNVAWNFCGKDVEDIVFGMRPSDPAAA